MAHLLFLEFITNNDFMVLYTLFQIIDLIFFIFIAISVLYIVVFAVASIFYHDDLFPESKNQRKILVFFPCF